ncbi:hypothetical protein A9Z05_05165 [Burkholderia sp. A2]|nr:hypothetical protein A9Z05_05165 [Burkholderia sp. A2]
MRETGPAMPASEHVAADEIDARTVFLMRCRRFQELRAYPVSKRGWMGSAGRTGLPVGAATFVIALF